MKKNNDKIKLKLYTTKSITINLKALSVSMH